jgi:hypothetical protein
MISRHAILAIASLGSLACVGGDEVRLTTAKTSEADTACPLEPHADMCMMHTSSGEQLTYLAAIAEYWGESRDVAAKLSAACTALAAGVGVPHAPADGPAIDQARETCRAVESAISTRGPFIPENNPGMSCTAHDRPSCAGVISLPPRVSCVPSKSMSFDHAEGDPRIAAVIEANLGAFLSAREDLFSIDDLVSPTTFPTKAEDVPEACIAKTSTAVGEATHTVTIAKQIVDGFLSAVSGLNGPLR